MTHNWQFCQVNPQLLQEYLPPREVIARGHWYDPAAQVTVSLSRIEPMSCGSRTLRALRQTVFGSQTPTGAALGVANAGRHLLRLYRRSAGVAVAQADLSHYLMSLRIPSGQRNNIRQIVVVESNLVRRHPTDRTIAGKITNNLRLVTGSHSFPRRILGENIHQLHSKLSYR
jgi:hypothetical protein